MLGAVSGNGSGGGFRRPRLVPPLDDRPAALDILDSTNEKSPGGLLNDMVGRRAHRAHLTSHWEARRRAMATSPRRIQASL